MKKCKVTSENLVSIMSFGDMPIANGFLDKDKFEKEFFWHF